MLLFSITRYSCFAFILTLGTLSVYGGEPQQPKDLDIYTFAELLQKANRIVTAEIGLTENGLTSITVLESLKGGAKKEAEAEKIKRAEAILRGEKVPEPAPEKLQIQSEIGKLPPAGAQALFFLWDRKDANGPYRLNHPQAIYDISLAATVKNALARTKPIADGRYLRDWDRQQAEKFKLRELDDTLRMQKGAPRNGLTLRAIKPARSTHGDNSFGLTVELENSIKQGVTLYDGPAPAFGVILRAKNGGDETKLILRTKSPTGLDEQTLNLPDATDFMTLDPGQRSRRELKFDENIYPQLHSLNGEFMLSVFYFNARTGGKLDLDGPPWTGAVVSEEIPIQFGKAVK